jgi:hypothetical protein
MAQDIPAVEELMPHMHFDENDLQHNRAGKLGENQRERLQGLQMRALLIGAGGFFAFALLATSFLFFAQENNSLILNLLGIFTTFINAIFIGIFGRQWMRLRADLSDDAVDLIQGQMERVLRPDSRMNNFLLRIEGEEFYIKKDLFRLFRHEVEYILYRAPHSRVLLAAEPAPNN